MSGSIRVASPGGGAMFKAGIAILASEARW